MSLSRAIGLILRLSELESEPALKGGKYMYVLMYLFETGFCQKPVSEAGVSISWLERQEPLFECQISK